MAGQTYFTQGAKSSTACIGTCQRIPSGTEADASIESPDLWLQSSPSYRQRLRAWQNRGDHLCVKTQKRPPEFDRELEESPGKAGGLLIRLLLAQGPPVISQVIFEQDLCNSKLDEFSHGLGREETKKPPIEAASSLLRRSSLSSTLNRHSTPHAVMTDHPQKRTSVSADVQVVRAESFPEPVAQRLVLVFAKEFSGL